MTYVETYLTGWVGERILADLRAQLFGHLQQLSLGFYERNRAGVIISRLTNDVEAIDQLVTDGVTTLVQITLTLVGTAVLLFVLDWRLALATLAVIPFMSVATVALPHALLPRLRGRARAARARDGDARRGHRRHAHGAGVHARGGGAARTSARSRCATATSNMQTVVLNGLYFPFVDLLSSVALAVVLGYGGHLYFGGRITLGTLFAFMLYVNNFFDPVQQLSQLYNTFLSATAALDKILGVLDERPRGRRPRRARGRCRASRATSASRTSASPTGAATEVLHGIDLDVPAGTTVALVGHTGAGKSTIAKLLARFYEPTRGRITIDGHDLNDVDAGVAPPPARRRAAGGVPLRRHGRARTSPSAGPDARPEEIVRAAQTVGAHEFVLRLEDGYETQLGERGSRLSLGQRQLVAFARALLADPRILILDEATSSVDIGTERTIERALRTLLADRTAFVIAHRLSTIRDADLIVVLEHGRVVEQGSHEELLARRGLYTSLYGDWAAGVAHPRPAPSRSAA